jgi:hypothetical protein
LQRHPAGGQHLQPWRRRQQRPHARSGLDEMLNIVEHNEHRLGRHDVSQTFGQRLPALLA